MKQLKIRNVVIMVAISLPVLIACGGDDNDEIHIEDIRIESSSSNLFQMFGINQGDYYAFGEYGFANYEDKIVSSLARKKDNKIYVAVYDKTKKSVIYTNTDVEYTKTIKTTYYEDTNEWDITHIGPIYGETKDGFIIGVCAWYEDRICVQNLLFYDGNDTRIMKMPLSSADHTYQLEPPFEYIDKWYDNSCILSKYGSRDCYTCYTDKGELIFSDKVIDKGDIYFPLSHDEYMCIDKLTVKWYNVQNNTCVRNRNLKLIDNYTNEVKISYTIEDSNSSFMAISAKFVWKDGTIKIVRFTLNVKTGEYVIDN